MKSYTARVMRILLFFPAVMSNLSHATETHPFVKICEEAGNGIDERSLLVRRIFKELRVRSKNCVGLVEAMKRTRRLDLDHLSKFQHLDLLDGFSHLEIFYMSNTDVTDLSRLPEIFPHLKVLSVSNMAELKPTQITDLSVLGDLPELEVLNLQNQYKVKDFSFLTKLTKLRSLRASQTQLSDLNLIRSKYVEHLNLYGTKITDFSPAERMSRPLRLVNDFGDFHFE